MTSFDFESLARQVDLVLEGGDGDRALECLREQNLVLKSRFPDDPFACVRADVFPAAQELVGQAIRLAEEFLRRGDTQREEMAWHLRSGPVCLAYGHHRHLVGPAMLDWAECNVRLGNQKKAEAIYQAVIKDFVELLDRPGAGDANRTALDCLKQALLASEQQDEELLRRTESLLASG